MTAPEVGEDARQRAILERQLATVAEYKKKAQAAQRATQRQRLTRRLREAQEERALISTLVTRTRNPKTRRILKRVLARL